MTRKIFSLHVKGVCRGLRTRRQCYSYSWNSTITDVGATSKLKLLALKPVMAKERAELPRCGSVRAIAKPPAKPTETEIEEVGLLI